MNAHQKRSASLYGIIFFLWLDASAGFGLKIPKLSNDKEEPSEEVVPQAEETAEVSPAIDYPSMDTSEMTGDQISTALQSAKGDNLLPAVALLQNLVGAARRNFLLANRDLALAVGLKEEAEIFEAQAATLGSDTVQTKDLKSVSIKTEASMVAVSEALTSKEPLSEQSKELYASGCSLMRKALLQEAMLIGATGYLGYETVQQGKKLKEEAKNRGMLGKAEVLKRAGKFTTAAAGTIYLVKQIPGDVKSGMETYELARAYGKENGIEIEELDDKKLDKLLAEAEEAGADAEGVSTDDHQDED